MEQSNECAQTNSLIEPERCFDRMLAFGLKVTVQCRNDNVLLPTNRTYSFLGYESFSDSARFLDNRSHEIFLSRQYSFIMSNFQYNDPNALKREPKSLPMIISADLSIKKRSSMVSITIGQIKMIQPSGPTPTHHAKFHVKTCQVTCS
ncbi:hypothetical protein VP01_2629g2 [Puccinia sorghi]|uniref:Uncharacterized protein n=1 Tax=Puccinia sorghi TaxID=27349 RepID=A0A0L6V4F3_9BASI|nr:hypothetical protein VP01_2629g2 [Puccinia sorghi]